MLSRFHDWPERLIAFLEDRRKRPFVWGEHDCTLFVADAVLAMTGTDMAAGFRGQYNSAVSGYGLMRQLGFNSADELVEHYAKQFEIAEIAPMMARRGDVLLLRTANIPDRLSPLGIVAPDGMAAISIAPNTTGLACVRLDAAARRGWAIGWEPKK